jgi:hypothetical protein
MKMKIRSPSFCKDTLADSWDVSGNRLTSNE